MVRVKTCHLPLDGSHGLAPQNWVIEGSEPLQHADFPMLGVEDMIEQRGFQNQLLDQFLHLDGAFTGFSRHGE